MTTLSFDVPKRPAIQHKPKPVRLEVAKEYLAKMKEIVGSA